MIYETGQAEKLKKVTAKLITWLIRNSDTLVKEIVWQRKEFEGNIFGTIFPWVTPEWSDPLASNTITEMPTGPVGNLMSVSSLWVDTVTYRVTSVGDNSRRVCQGSQLKMCFPCYMLTGYGGVRYQGREKHSCKSVWLIWSVRHLKLLIGKRSAVYHGWCHS